MEDLIKLLVVCNWCGNVAFKAKYDKKSINANHVSHGNSVFINLFIIFEILQFHSNFTSFTSNFIIVIIPKIVFSVKTSLFHNNLE